MLNLSALKKCRIKMNMKSKLALIVSYKESSMNWLKRFKTIGLALILGLSLTACGAGKSSWKEEVLLHEGSKIIVERSVDRGGRHEIGQEPPIEEQSFIFTMPKTNENITWKSGFSKDIGIASLQPLALDISQGLAYLVTHPVMCLAYNKWGRPNPPYIFFKYTNQQWKQIPLSELPVEIKEINMLIDAYGNNDLDQAVKSGFVSADRVKKLNDNGNKAAEYKSILREPIKANTPGTDGSAVNCEVMDYYKGAWVGSGDSIGKRMMDKMDNKSK
jgi:hypothetical protein